MEGLCPTDGNEANQYSEEFKSNISFEVNFPNSYELEVNKISKGSTIIEVVGGPIVIFHVVAAFQQAKNFIDNYWELVKGNAAWDITKWTASTTFSTLIARRLIKTHGPAQRLTASAIKMAIEVYAQGDAGDKLTIELKDTIIRFEKSNYKDKVEVEDDYEHDEIFLPSLEQLSKDDLIILIQQLIENKKIITYSSVLVILLDNKVA
jgi:hypothetical protein